MINPNAEKNVTCCNWLHITNSLIMTTLELRHFKMHSSRQKCKVRMHPDVRDKGLNLTLFCLFPSIFY